MKRVLTFLGALAVVAAAPAQGGERTLSKIVAVSSVERVSVDAGVGSLDVAPAPGDQLMVSVRLKPRRGGIFSSMERALEQVEEAELVDETVGDTLYLEVSAPSGDRRFEERWILQLPRDLHVDLEIGVGDISVRDIAGDIAAEVGVGDVTIVAGGGDISIELGVGDAEIEGMADTFGAVEASGGVGEADIVVRGQKISRGGFVGHEASWTGDGDARIAVEVGVGEAVVRLR